MTQSIQKIEDVNMIESLVLKGDLSGLSPQQKVEYYRLMCERVGLDPTTQPFKLLNLSGKQVMYCDRSGAQQLNKIHHVSHRKLEEKEIRDVFIVYMRNDLANAIMKAETKAKRRATLDLLGLGILDESEIETISTAQKMPLLNNTGEVLDDSMPEKPEQVQSQGASFNQFDPRTEIMNFGKKHNGVLWVEVPSSYLEWMAESSSGEYQIKAKATLEFKKQISEQIPDPLDNAFGKKSPVIPSEGLMLIEQLQYNLEEVDRKEGTVESLEGWKKINQPDIDRLSPAEKTILKKIYTAAINKAKGTSK
jgi:hypothetical protein